MSRLFYRDIARNCAYRFNLDLHRAQSHDEGDSVVGSCVGTVHLLDDVAIEEIVSRVSQSISSTWSTQPEEVHYVKDYESALRKIEGCLRPRGRLVFSVEHPIYTARAEQEWARSEDGVALYWPIDSYRPEGERKTKWFVENVLKYHRTVETYVNGLIATGFRLQRLLEPAPATTAISADIDLERRRPPFLLLSATR